LYKILIIGPSWVGDTVLAQPLFIRLHQNIPDLQLDVFALPYLAPLLARIPEVSEVIPNPFHHGQLKLRERRRLGRSLMQRHYDQAIVLPNSLKSALVPFFAHIPKRTGYIGEMRWLLLNDARKLDKKRVPLMVERFCSLADEANTALPQEIPAATLNAAPEKAQQTLHQLGLEVNTPVAILCPGAEYGPAKRWPAHYFAALASRLAQEGYVTWIIGSAKDAVLGQEIRKHHPDSVDLCGKTTLDQAIDLISLAAIVVSNDSGLMHVAAALGRPLIAIYGSSSPGFTPPLSPKAQVVKLDLECSPCFKRTCPLGHFKCMMALTPELVFAKINACKNN
jgi:heptosyltransferase II